MQLSRQENVYLSKDNTPDLTDKQTLFSEVIKNTGMSDQINIWSLMYCPIAIRHLPS